MIQVAAIIENGIAAIRIGRFADRKILLDSVTLLG